jgi:2-amino-4-hydroxy-6-hydroxymethyldihydropteridine diphosphokinase
MAAKARQAFIGVGANLGDRWGNIRTALGELARTPGIVALEESAVFETAPVGVTDQPEFLNLVVGIETILKPEELLEVLLGCERAAGRNREKEVRWGPRSLDLDLLLFEGEKRTGAKLELPHPRMWERAFVLAPLRELLERSARYQNDGWRELRERLAQTVISEAGVRRWTPPGA